MQELWVPLTGPWFSEILRTSGKLLCPRTVDSASVKKIPRSRKRRRPRAAQSLYTEWEGKSTSSFIIPGANSLSLVPQRVSLWLFWKLLPGALMVPRFPRCCSKSTDMGPGRWNEGLITVEPEFSEKREMVQKMLPWASLPGAELLQAPPSSEACGVDWCVWCVWGHCEQLSSVWLQRAPFKWRNTGVESCFCLWIVQPWRDFRISLGSVYHE